MRPTFNLPLVLSAIAVASLAILPTASADVVRLKSGASVDCTVLKRTERRIWVYVGPDVLSFDMNDVASVESENALASVEVQQDTLF